MKTNISSRFAIDLDTVYVMKSDINYTHIHFKDGKKMLSSYTIAKVFATLPKTGFVRISRQIVVNRDAIYKFEECNKLGQIELNDGSIFKVSRRRVDSLRAFLEI